MTDTATVQAQEKLLVTDNIWLDPKTRVLEREGRKHIILGHTPVKILVTIITAAGKVVSPETLFPHLVGKESHSSKKIENANANVHICRLRAALKKMGVENPKKFLISTWGMGYRIATAEYPFTEKDHERLRGYRQKPRQKPGDLTAA